MWWFGREFPYSNFHDMNDNWILSKLGLLDKSVEESKNNAEESKVNADASKVNADIALESANISTENANMILASYNKIQENSDDISNLDNRVDSFTRLGEGSTTGDAELIDGRIGYDDVTYDNIGGAIRGQFSDLSKRGNTIIYPSEFTLGGINSDGSDAISSARSRTQLYYRATKGTILTVDSTMNWGVYEYNDNGELLYHHSGWLNADSVYEITQDCIFRVLQQSTTPVNVNVNRLLDIRKTSLNDDTYNASQLLYYHGHSNIININENTCELLNIALDENGYDSNVSNIRTSTPFIPCCYRDLLKYNGGGSNPQFNVFFFDKNKNFISKIAETGTWFGYATFINIPLNAKYLRIMQNTANRGWAGFDFYEYNKLDINSLDYEAFKLINKKENDTIKWDIDFINGSHRGYMEEAPESTTPAFIIAKNKGYNALEFDVRITSDNEFVINHDPYMPSDRNYLIAEHTLQELRTNANMGTYKGDTLPILTLEDTLKMVRLLNMKAFIEFKVDMNTSQYESIAKMIVDYGLNDYVYVMVNNTTADIFYNNNIMLAWFEAETSDVDTIKNYNIDNQPMKNVVYRRCDIMTHNFIKAFTTNNIMCVGWSVSWDWMYPNGYTMEQVKQDIVNSILNGSNGIITDKLLLNEILEEYSQSLL